jgi:hypothetical protein
LFAVFGWAVKWLGILKKRTTPIRQMKVPYKIDFGFI